jgi:type IV secretory pathway VirB4 component
MLAMAVPKRHYYYSSPLGRRLISLGLGPVALSFLGMAGREAVVKVNELMATHRGAWPAAWLRHRGLDEAADAWMEHAGRVGE